MIATIVAGCDLSAPSDLAVDRAVELALGHGARLVLVHAQHDAAEADAGDPELLETIGEVTAAVRVEAARHLADRLALIQKRGVASVSTHLHSPSARRLRCSAFKCVCSFNARLNAEKNSDTSSG